MSRSVSIEQMADAIMEELQEYADAAALDVKAAVRKSANTVKKQISEKAPVGKTGRYAKSWRVKPQKKTVRSWCRQCIPPSDICWPICWKRAIPSAAVAGHGLSRISRQRNRPASNNWINGETHESGESATWNVGSNTVVIIIDGFLGLFGTDWNTVWSSVSTFFSNTWAGITNFFNTSIATIKHVWGTVSGFFQGVWRGVQSVFSNVIGFFSGTFDNAKQAVVNVWNAVKSFFCQTFRAGRSTAIPYLPCLHAAGRSAGSGCQAHIVPAESDHGINAIVTGAGEAMIARIKAAA